MNDNEKKMLIEKIKNAIKISGDRLIQKKKQLGQDVVVSENGVIKTIKAADLKL